MILILKVSVPPPFLLVRLYYLGCARIAADAGMYSFIELRVLQGKSTDVSPQLHNKVKAQNKWSTEGFRIQCEEGIPITFDD
jgi:hypothetical protein